MLIAVAAPTEVRATKAAIKYFSYVHLYFIIVLILQSLKPSFTGAGAGVGVGVSTGAAGVSTGAAGVLPTGAAGAFEYLRYRSINNGRWCFISYFFCRRVIAIIIVGSIMPFT